MNENNEKKQYTVAKRSLILRIVVSLYLLYVVYGLFGSLGTTSGTDKIVVIIAMVVFTVVAIPLGGLSIKAMTRGEYNQGGAVEESSEDSLVDVADSADVVHATEMEEDSKETYGEADNESQDGDTME